MLATRPRRRAHRVRAHVLLCMLAYHLEWHMRQALRPILFEDDDTPKPKTKRPQLPIADLATLTRNIVAIEPDLENPS